MNQKMEKKSYWAIIAVSIIVIGAIIGVVVWQTTGSTAVKEDDGGKSEEDLDDRSLVIVNEQDQDLSFPVKDSDEATFTQMINVWLGNRKSLAATNPIQATTQRTHLHLGSSNADGEYPFTRTELPFKMSAPNCHFGYGMDTKNGYTVVGAPGMNDSRGVVYIYLGMTIVQTIECPRDCEKFGLMCMFSEESEKLLVIQSDTKLHIYTWKNNQFMWKMDFDLDSNHHVLGIFLSMIWISNPHTETFCVYHTDNNIFYEESVSIMDVYYESKKTIWATTPNGLVKYKLKKNKLSKNGHWHKGVALTTVEMIWNVDGDKFLVVSQAHLDSLSIVSVDDPGKILDTTKVPGGPRQFFNVLYGDSVLWYKSLRLVAVSAPLDYVNGTKHSGSIMFYSFKHDGTLMPTSILWPDDPKSAKFGSVIKQFDSETMIVSAPGANRGRGQVYLIKSS